MLEIGQTAMVVFTDKYILGRDYVASARLNLQHFLWKTQQGFLLHPSISLDHDKPICIADVGTGTGFVNVIDCPPRRSSDSIVEFGP